jgi:hypothetical protein
MVRHDSTIHISTDDFGVVKCNKGVADKNRKRTLTFSFVFEVVVGDVTDCAKPCGTSHEIIGYGSVSSPPPSGEKCC